MADNTHLDLGRGYDEILNRQVFACRIAVHSLGRQGDPVSENHLTIYLLIGSERSVRLDMAVADDLNTGILKVTVHNYSLSTNVVRYVDIAVTDQPTDFHPSSTPSRVGQPDVKTFVMLLVMRNYQFFRYFYVNGHSAGCRGWVSATIEAFNEQQLLVMGGSVEQITSHLIANQFDADGTAIQIPYTPGLFRSNQTPIILTRDQLCAAIWHTSYNALTWLAAACAYRDELVATVPVVVDQFRTVGNVVAVQQHLYALATVGAQEPRDLAIASDLVYATLPTLQALYAALLGRYRIASNAINLLISCRESGDLQSSVALALAAVMDMATGEDIVSEQEETN